MNEMYFSRQRKIYAFPRNDPKNIGSVFLAEKIYDTYFDEAQNLSLPVKSRNLKNKKKKSFLQE